jgi:L-rhamnose mutarotase
MNTIPRHSGPPASAQRQFQPRALFCLVLAGLLAGCAAPSAPKRFAWITGLKPEKVERYEDLHAHPWPGVNKMLKACHIQNYSIYEREIEGKIYLCSYLEYTGKDFDADMKRMAADPETQRWWKETDPCQLPLPDAAAKGKIWSDMKEVYYLK